MRQPPLRQQAGRFTTPVPDDDGQGRGGDPPRILSEKECDDIVARVRGFAQEGGDTGVAITSWWQGELRWGRNRTTMMSDRRDLLIKVSRNLPNTPKGYAITNQLDDTSLEAAVRAAERHAQANGVEEGVGMGFYPPLPKYPPPPQPIWSDATFNASVEDRVKLARTLMDAAEAKGMLSAGYLEVRATSVMALGTDMTRLRTEKYAFWEKPYRAYTQAQCSLTVRNPEGTGSGWAGLSSYDLAKIDTAKLGEVALQKCLASQNPVALEPGRYTVILEPAAVAALMEPLVDSFQDRNSIEGGYIPGPWSLKRGYSKLGLKVVDDRISIWHDPRDPRLGVILDGTGDPGPITWIEKGVLKNLATDNPTASGRESTDGGGGLDYTMGIMKRRYTVRKADGYQMSGGTTSVEEMVSKTQRGLLVSRLSGVSLLQSGSLLSTGFTRDGLWLIENGKITKAVKNFRFADSPLFMLNTIDDLGEPVPIFRPTSVGAGDRNGYMDAPGLTPAIVPPMRVHDFNFTAMIDAV